MSSERWSKVSEAAQVTDVVISDAAEAGRYEARIGGEVAGVLEYILKYGRIALVHTEVAPGHAGQGVAGRLARFALDDARRRGLRVIPSCPFVRAYLERHPEDHDLVIGAVAGSD
jgi:predicted GNAT family acetyltransferase